MTAAQVREVARALTRRRGARVDTAHQDAPSRFRLVLATKRGREDLVLDIDRAWPRLHLAPHARAPARPTPLAAILRRRLAGARLEGARAVAGERAVGIVLVRGGPWTVWFEAFGRGANLYLVDPEGVVRLTPRGEVARRRGAAVGETFQARPPRAAPEDEAAGPRTEGDPDAASETVAREAGEDRARREDEARRRALGRALSRARAKTERALARLDAAAGREAEAEALEREGRLLQASFHRLRPGQASVRVPDHEAGGAEVEIALDPTRPPGEQVGARFGRAKKLRRGVAEAEARSHPLRERLAALEAAAARAEGPLAGFAEALAAAGVEAPRPAPAPRAPARARPWRSYRSADGWTIHVARDAAGGDLLTTREARPHDLWLHVRGATGSHVVVPTPRGKTVPLPTLLDAAELAAHFSALEGAPVVEVDHVERRHVRKPRGAPAGTVVLARARTLRLERDPQRLRRLLTSRADSS